MATLKEFEESLREHGMNMALALLERLRERDRAIRTVKPARRLTGQKMTPELAHAILDLHASTGMTQQEIAFKVGVNQGRVNEVIKRGKWLDGDPHAPEAVARDKALARLRGEPTARKAPAAKRAAGKSTPAKAKIVPAPRRNQGQLAFGDL
ncbi:RNA polymerase subunit sigma-70 [Methylobacterium sp. WL30]|uniref:RNA polymerase subunit sigma-70 n=1 Tax=unclassified Methylobacterium TaxID=2615210 RepID=UPI0011C87E11|nr:MULTISPECIES: RNA polymerase subunit sigma-70 [unclassified Methylobacterium]TXM89187.1 RNA polymerase subunit sigma-70 [Methylobacterium sp. WL116]TXN34462.1 RNA polymerase subunit sigma-70 [Methylobacterium sp. WL93]TXN46185.1 RNA polymerase subunit sigma-70 [Methylobacterium sp. WL119]TXN64057.1 RNA polymerase subunit sigma-70 [Methylobacterium sp. WL30]